jgi:hypothetical protein
MLSAGAEYAAPIFEALGKHDVAEALWGDRKSHSEVEWERDDLLAELDRLADRLEQLESLICENCERQWRSR